MSARSAARCPVRGEYCGEHGFIHGGEADELRAGLEKLMANNTVRSEEWPHYAVRVDDLQKLLDRVDARDSIAFVEAPKRPRRRSKALVELTTMLVALLRDAKDFFAVGAYRCRKKLTNGAIVTFSIKMPPEAP